MGYNIGPKIGIEGEQEFRKQIKNINDSYKALEAETRAVAAAFEANGDEQGKLEATSKQLQKQIDLQKQKMSALQDAINKASEKYKDNSIEVTRLRGAYYDTQATVAGLENELKDTHDRLVQAGRATDQFVDQMEAAGDKAIDFGDILKANLASEVITEGLEKAGEIVKDFASGTIEAAADTKAANSQFSQSFGSLEDTARDALENISDDTNIASTRIQKNYTQIFAFAKTVGAESYEALDIASRAMVAGADSAAYYDKSIEDVVETLQSFLKGNYENDAALGISATEVSRNTMANQLYAMSFKELSESQKVDTLLAMVEAGNAASGAIGQAARESGEWGNVTGELAEVYRQLQVQVGKPALQKLVPVIQKITDAGYELIEDVDWDEFGEKFENTADAVIDNGPAMVKAITSLAAGFVAFKATKKAGDLVTLAAGFVKTATAAHTAGTAVAASGAVAAMSPWGLAATAIAGVVALVTSLAIEAETSVSDLERSIERLKNSMENANETYAESTAEINGAATAAEHYISRLYELEAAGLNNNAASREYEMTVEALNELIPNLNLAIDEQTGLVNANKDALLAEVEAWKQNATAKALQEKYTDVLEAQARAEADVIDAQARLNQMIDKAEPIEAKLTDAHKRKEAAYQKLYTAQEKYRNSTNLTTSEANSLMIEIGNLGDEYDLINEEYLSLYEQVIPLRKEQEKLKEEITDASKVVASYDKEIQNAKDAMELFNEQTAAGEDAQSEWELQLQSVQSEIDELTSAYSEAKTAAKESLETQVGLFDELSTESEWSAKKIISNWEKQRRAFLTYETNLQRAKRLGLADAIVEQLSDGSEESMQILDALVNDSSISVEEINAAFQGMDASRDKVSEVLADIQTDFNATMFEIAANAKTKGIVIGTDFVAGLAEGLSDPWEALEKYNSGISNMTGVIDSLMNGRAPVFKFEQGLNDQLSRAETYPGMFASAVHSTSNQTTKTTNYGGVNIQIQTQPGQNSQEIAEMVMNAIKNEIYMEGAGA